MKSSWQYTSNIYREAITQSVGMISPSDGRCRVRLLLPGCWLSCSFQIISIIELNTRYLYRSHNSNYATSYLQYQSCKNNCIHHSPHKRIISTRQINNFRAMISICSIPSNKIRYVHRHFINLGTVELFNISQCSYIV